MIDTHTHLYLPEFDSDGGGVAAVQRALNANVTHLVFPNVDRSTIEPMEQLAAQFPDNISCAMGLHPTEVNDHADADLDFIIEKLTCQPRRYVAVGEIGSLSPHYILRQPLTCGCLF